MKKILDVGYWWPTMNRDVHEFCWTCDLCQRISNLLAQNVVKLITTLFEKPFQKWGLDFIGPIKPPIMLLSGWTLELCELIQLLLL